MAGGAPMPSDRVADHLAAFYREGAKRLYVLMQGAVLSGRVADLAAYKEQAAQMLAVAFALESQAAPVLTQAIREAYLLGRVDAAAALTGANVANITEKLGSRDLKALDLLIDSATSDLGKARELIGRRTDDVLRRVALASVVQSEGQQMTRKQAGALLRDAIETEGLAFADEENVFRVNVSGRNLKLDDYADMVVRTTPREAHFFGFRNKLEDAGERYISISHHGGSCEQCAAVDGKTFALRPEWVTAEYPLIPNTGAHALVPVHPKCRHRAIGARV